MPQFDFYVFLDIYIYGFTFFIFTYILMVGYFLPGFYRGFYSKLYFDLISDQTWEYSNYGDSLFDIILKKTLFSSFSWLKDFLIVNV